MEKVGNNYEHDYFHYFLSFPILLHQSPIFLPPNKFLSKEYWARRGGRDGNPMKDIDRIIYSQGRHQLFPVPEKEERKWRKVIDAFSRTLQCNEGAGETRGEEFFLHSMWQKWECCWGYILVAERVMFSGLWFSKEDSAFPTLSNNVGLMKSEKSVRTLTFYFIPLWMSPK